MKSDNIITYGIIGIVAATLIYRLITRACAAVVTIGYDITNSISQFLTDFAPDWFWTLSIIMTTTIIIIGVAIAIKHKLSSLQYKSQIHEIRGSRAIIYHRGAPIAVSYSESPVDALRLAESDDLTDDEIRILNKLARRHERQIRITNSSQNRHVIDCRKPSKFKRLGQKKINYDGTTSIY
jgi:hypothetical protein